MSYTGRIGLLTGVGHVGGSFLLGLVVILLGVGAGSIVRVSQSAVGPVLALTGALYLVYAIWQARRGGHSHDHPHDHSHDHPHLHGDVDTGEEGEAVAATVRPAGLSWAIPIGVAASPDLTVLPVFLAALPLGAWVAAIAAVLYAVVTIAVITSLTVLATAGGYQLDLPWLEKNGNIVAAFVLIALGVAAWRSL